MPAKKPDSSIDPAWGWAKTSDTVDVTDTHVETAYRLRLPKCEACKNNCKKNPRCLNGLGATEWMGEREDADLMIYEDPNDESRPKDSFVGLQNLGATCYVNSFLQLWFHNPTFRKAVYQCKSEEISDYLPTTSTESMSDLNMEVAKEDVDLERPTSVVGQLQLIFALMQFGKRRFVDPSPFVKSLGLNTDEQQDAQEFSKLFLSLLESKLNNQASALASNVISNQFSGRYEYVTKCSVCKIVSASSSTFCELDLNIKDKKSLGECMENFLMEEKLEGADQYFCQSCNFKVNAGRSINLRQLPPVLNLQLLRYAYDKKSSKKRKLTSALDFPEVLNMTEYGVDEDQETIYDLSAVLLHYGSNTDSGHFLAHINDRNSNSWFTFNDEEVTKIAALKLGGEAAAKKLKSGKRLVNGHHRSSDVYMLVYQRRETNTSALKQTSLDSFDHWCVPDKIKDLVLQDNCKFDAWVNEMNNKRAQSLKNGKDRIDEVKSVFTIMACDDVSTSAWSFLPTDWIRTWLKNVPTPVPAIEFSYGLCPHSRLGLESVTTLKCISESAACLLHDKYGGQPLLGKNSLCRECVVIQGQRIRRKILIEEDQKFIKRACDPKTEVGKMAFWVGKTSFEWWETLATVEVSGGDVLVAKGSKTVGKEGVTNFLDKRGRETTKCAISNFNEDIVCSHNNMTSKTTRRRLISASVWSRFKLYFPSAPEFNEATDPCSECQIAEAMMKKSHDAHRKMAAEQKSSLAALYLGKNRPILNIVPDVPTTYYIVRKEFVVNWRKFLRNASHESHVPVVDVANSELLCRTHQGLVCQVHDADEAADKIVLLREKEWNLVTALFQADVEISVTVRPPQVPGNAPILVFTPDMCLPCIELRRMEVQQQRFHYERAVIYVKKVQPEKKLPDEVIFDEGMSEHDNQGDPPKPKRKKKEAPKSSYRDGQTTLVRKSSRRRTGKNERLITVSSSQTLRDLKLEIMRAFSAAPFDQHIMLNDVALVDNEMSLGELGILPNCVLQLTVDEPGEGEKEVAPEEGFKGTELLRS